MQGASGSPRGRESRRHAACAPSCWPTAQHHPAAPQRNSLAPDSPSEFPTSSSAFPSCPSSPPDDVSPSPRQHFSSAKDHSLAASPDSSVGNEHFFAGDELSSPTKYGSLANNEGSSAEKSPSSGADEGSPEADEGPFLAIFSHFSPPQCRSSEKNRMRGPKHRARKANLRNLITRVVSAGLSGQEPHFPFRAPSSAFHVRPMPDSRIRTAHPAPAG